MSRELHENSFSSPTRARYQVLALIAFATMLNYLDRSLLSVAAPQLSADLSLGPAAMGILFSVFSWTYALAQIPGGLFLDKFGTRRTYFLSLVSWSGFTVLQGATFNLWSLVLARLGLGAAEAPCFPANSRVLVTWFPQQERARANSVYSVGMYFGIAFLSPVLFWVTVNLGWRVLFFLVGAIGVAFGFVWLRVYREPNEHKWINQSERDLITAGGGVAAPSESMPFSWRNVGWLLRQRQIFGASIGQFATNSTLVFFLTWFPSYLAVERGMDWIKVGFYAVLPFISASLGVLVGGQLSDYLAKRSSLSIARKLPIVSGLLLSSTIVSAIYVESDVLIIAIMSIAFFGQGMSNLGWTLVSEVAPIKLVGVTGGVFNFFTNLAGIVTPIAIGIIVQSTGSFYGGLAFISAVAAIGVASYIFIVGDVRRISLPATCEPRAAAERSN